MSDKQNRIIQRLSKGNNQGFSESKSENCSTWSSSAHESESVSRSETIGWSKSVGHYRSVPLAPAKKK